MFDRSNAIGGSGLFVCEQLFSREVQITSPYLKSNATLEQADAATGSETAVFIQVAKQSPDVFPISQPHLTTYAERLIEVARIIKESAYDIVLCPMRGARMAGLQTDLICETEPIEPFDAVEMAKRINDDRILADLRQLLFDSLRNSGPQRIGVLDTADGGDSCREMARLLRQLNDEVKEHWSVHFHLIHADGRRPPRATQAYSFGSNRIAFGITYHPVADLLIEDEPKLLGYDISRGGGRSHIFRFQQEGQILLHGPEKATLFRRGPVDETMIALVSREIRDVIQGMPDIRPITLDYWPYDS